jgi:hypothetical protein
VLSLVVTCHHSFQSRISLYSLSDSLITSLLNSIVFTTTIKFTAVACSVDMLSIVRGCVDQSASQSSGVSCIYIRHMLAHLYVSTTNHTTKSLHRQTVFIKCSRLFNNCAKLHVLTNLNLLAHDETQLY